MINHSFLHGQYKPESGGHNTPESHGQLSPVLGGQYHRFLQTWGNYEYSIYNLQGQKVDCGKTVSININCTNLNEGIYFVKIQNEYLSKNY